LHDDGVALKELALVDQHTVRDLPQHGAPPAYGLQPLVETVADPSLIQLRSGLGPGQSRTVVLDRRVRPEHML
jgi:hypothetical protein